MKIKKIYLPILICTALAVGLLLGNYLNFPTNKQGFAIGASHKNKLNKLIDFIENEYIDDINADSIVDLTVNNILESLDPHSIYISKNEIESVNRSMKGDFVGIGVNFYMYNDSLAIIKPIENGPSEKAGLLPGDRILFADNYKLSGKKLPNDSIFAKLKGDRGSKVKLTVFRKSENKTFNVQITRDVVPIKSVDIATVINNSIGYIKINRFAETTYKEFHKGLAELKEKGINELIIDLRDNGGGYLEMAVEIADDLLADGQLIVKTKNKKGRIDNTFATKKGIFEEGNVTILINENSASASEILAGAIQDNDRGTIIGRRSFGKGLVQREMPLGDGSAVRLTVARYYTPSGRSIQKDYSHGNKDYFNEFQKRFESGELYAADSIKIADTLKFKTANGRIVYGGGGIIPDVFIPIEANHGSEAVSLIMQSGIVSYFVFEQLDKNRNDFKKLTPELLFDKITKNNNYYNAFKSYLLKNNLVFDLDKYKEKTKRYLAAEFGRQLFNEEIYYRIILKEDNMVNNILTDNK